MSTSEQRTGRRFLVMGAGAALALAVFQAPGRIVPETKLDLAIDPLRYLGAALRMWDDTAAFGQVRNQAVGYLFPMGPFFALGDALHLPMWTVQRAWMAVLLVVAFWGTVRLADALRVGQSSSRVVAGAVYALSPPMVTLVGVRSGGQLAFALLPWVVLPLVKGGRGGSARLAAARSGLAVVAMGGINAATTLSALPLPALFLLTRQRGRRRVALMAWWVLAVLLATLWWVIPLLLQGRYGFNFVPFTESAAVTTATQSLTQVLRGAGHWLSWLVLPREQLPAGRELETSGLLIVSTGTLAALGLYGLARRDMPERTWLGFSSGLAVVALAAGYGGRLGGPLSDVIQSLLDGPLAPLRNVDKFQPVLRLPLALGAAHAVAVIRVRDARRPVAALVVGALVVVGALPFLRGSGTADGGFRRIPAYWEESARWLDEHGRGQRALLLPADAFAEYQWGRPLDEPFQTRLDTPWAVRNLIPLGRPELTTLLDEIGERVERGAPLTGLADVLARMGVRHVVLRNDLDRVRSTAPAVAYLTRALSGAPGMRLAAEFGPVVESQLTTDRLASKLATVNEPVPAIQVFEVERRVRHATVYPAADAVDVIGGPDALFGLAERGELDGRAVLLNGDDARHEVVSDGRRARDVDFGLVRNNASFVLAAGEADGRDWIGEDHGRSLARTVGAVAVEASSYPSSVTYLPEYQPVNAFDGDSATAWVAGGAVASGEWVEVRTARDIAPPTISLRLFRDHGWRPWIRAIRLTTDAGSVDHLVAATEEPQVLSLPRGATRRVRLTILAADGGQGAGVRGIDIAGVRVTRPVVTPKPGGGAVAFAFERSVADPYDATRADEEANLERRFTVGTAGAMDVTGTAVANPAADLSPFLPRSDGLRVTATSTWEGLPAFGAVRLLDGDISTAWVAAPEDDEPVLDVSWGERRTIDAVRLVGTGGPIRAPHRVRLVSPAGTRDVRLAIDGTARFDPLETDHLSVQFVEANANVGARGLLTPAAVAVAELSFPTLADLVPPAPDLSAPVRVDCGGGPVLDIAGTRVETALEGTVGDIVELRPLTLRGCAAVDLAAGEQSLSTPRNERFAVNSLTLSSGPLPDTDPPRRVTVERWSSDERFVRVGAGRASYIVTDENFNDGWRARWHGRDLTPARVDGWRQGWRLPAGAAGTVEMEYRPERTYRFSLVAGAVALFALVALAAVRRRGARPPAVGPASVGPRVAAGLALGVSALVAGITGLVAAALVLLGRLRPSRLAALAGTAYLAAVAIAAAEAGRFPGSHAGAYGRLAQVLAAVAVAALLAALVSRADE